MKALLICPADRPAVAQLAEQTPLAATAILGRTAIEYWIEWLVAHGATHVTLLASDRPNTIRALLGDGRRWGIRLDVVPTAREFTVEEARAKYRPREANDWLHEADVTLIDHLPGQPEWPLFDSYAGWFNAVRAWMPQAVTPGRIGVRQVQPGVWIGLRAEISATARLHAPCWIGDYARIGAHAEIGPGAVVDDRVVVDDGARVIESVVTPATYVGKYVCLERSIAQGALLTNWHTGSSVAVPDAFLLSRMSAKADARRRSSPLARGAAALAMIVAAPFAIGMILLSILRGESPWQLRLGLQSQRGARRLSHDTFAYYELTGASNWLRRWPQFWNVVRGDMTWFGNRPLRPTQALALATDFERLWLAAPVGLISLADAHGCREGISEESCAHSSYYAVHAGLKLDWFIFSRALLRAAMVWPFRGQRRKEATVPLEQLVPKQEI